MEEERRKPEVVRGGEAVKDIPPETRWTVAAQGLTGAYVATAKANFDALGQEKYNEIGVQVKPGAPVGDEAGQREARARGALPTRIGSRQRPVPVDPPDQPWMAPWHGRLRP